MTKPILLVNPDMMPSQLCDGCKKQTPVVVRVGDELDWESATADLCLECLEEAVALARMAPRG